MKSNEKHPRRKWNENEKVFVDSTKKEAKQILKHKKKLKKNEFTK